MMGVGVKRGFIIRHMDVVTAFLYSYLDELIMLNNLIYSLPTRTWSVSFSKHFMD